RALVRLVRRVAGNGKGLEPAVGELGRREDADDGQQDPDTDDEQPVPHDEPGKARHRPDLPKPCGRAAHRYGLSSRKPNTRAICRPLTVMATSKPTTSESPPDPGQRPRRTAPRCGEPDRLSGREARGPALASERHR